MGIADRNQTIVQLAQHVPPGFALALISGFILFATDAASTCVDLL